MKDKNNMFKNPFSEEVWSTTYKDHNDKTVEDTLRRVAKAIAGAEKTDDLKKYWEERFYELMLDFKMVPGGRILANAGTEWNQTTLFNCYVSPMPKVDIDSIEGIYKLLTYQANTLKSEGGYGVNFSHLRPRGSFITGIGVDSPGSIKFAELFDKSSEIVTAGSGKVKSNSKGKDKIRKGAQMLCLNCNHPDIVEFITAKQTPGRLTKFNVSVGISEEFMDKVLSVKDTGNMDLDKWELIFPDTKFEKYKQEWDGDIKGWQEKGYPVIIHDTISATWLWDLIMESTYSRNEPGVIFLDRANELNPARACEKIVSTNPCGEIPLPPGGICCLGALNLTQFINTDLNGFDLDRVSDATRTLVRFLDNVNTVSNAPLPEYIWSKEHKRRIGCNIMGWGSSLFMLKVRFGSIKAEEIKSILMSTIAKSAYESSIDLAVEKGMYSVCVKEDVVETPFVKSLNLSDSYISKLKQYGIRNSAILSSAPNGNTSILANVISGGVEPIFMPEYIRTVIVGSIPDHLKEITPDFHKGEFNETEFFKFSKEGDDIILKGTDVGGITWKIDQNRGLTKEVPCEDYSVTILKAKGEWNPKADWAVTTSDISAEEHVSDLAGFCKFIDNSVSKTINLPNDYSFENFKDLYLTAYQTGVIKGLTTYRAGTMMSVLSAKDEKDASAEEEEIILEDVKLPDSAPALVKTFKANQNKWYVTVIMNEANNRPFALFVTTNVHEPNVTTFDAVERLLGLAMAKGIPEKHIDEIVQKIKRDNNHTKVSRIISLLLRHGVFIRNIVSTLDGIEDIVVGSFLFQIKKFLTTFIKDGEKVLGQKCLECKGELIYESGCSKCIQCGASKCS